MANTTKKPTIVQRLNEIKEILETNGLLTPDLEEFLDKRIEVTEKKNASGNSEKKLTKAQEANESYKSAILDEMKKDKSYTISDMLKTLPCCEMLSQNKVNALVKQLKDEGKVIRSEIKGKAYFTLA